MTDINSNDQKFTGAYDVIASVCSSRYASSSKWKFHCGWQGLPKKRSIYSSAIETRSYSSAVWNRDNQYLD